MPRPKREEPMEPRSIRMTDSEYAQFKAAGGTDWLRMTLRHMTEKTRIKAKRNLQIASDHKAGMSDTAISEKYGIDRATVWRARQ